MKKIWLWLLLLLLLIIICVSTKKDSMHLSTATESTHLPLVKKEVTHKQYIEYTITQSNDHYILNGNFKDTQQQILLENTFEKAHKTLLIKNTSTNNTLLGDPAITLTQTILPHFIAQYVDSKISYRNQKLKITGKVKNYEAQHEMQRLLNTSTIASQDNTNVIVNKPMSYRIDKKDNTLHLKGIFHDKIQVEKLTKSLPSQATSDFKIDAHYVDTASLPIVEKLLPTFVSTYTEGSIQYQNEKLTVVGKVHNERELHTVDTLLSHSSIHIENKTIVDPLIAKREEEAKKLAAEKAAKEKEAIEKSKLEAEKKAAAEAQAAHAKKVQEEIQAKLKAKLELAKKQAEKQEINKAKIQEERAKKVQEETKAKLELAKKEAEKQEINKAKIQEERAKKVQEETKAKLELAKKEKSNATHMAQEKTQQALALKKKMKKLFTLENIEFNVNKSTLTKKGEATIQKLAHILKQYPSIKIEIAGHTDSDGSEQYNQRLSQSRVDQVKFNLIKQHIAASRLTAKGYGESHPLVPNTSDANKQKNRRVDINIQGE